LFFVPLFETAVSNVGKSQDHAANTGKDENEPQRYGHRPPMIAGAFNWPQTDNKN
jgi:hypothetical protein